MEPENQKDTPTVSPVPSVVPPEIPSAPPAATVTSPSAVPTENVPISVVDPLFFDRPKVNLLSQSKLLAASLVIYVLDGMCLLLSSATRDVGTANNIARTTVWLGLLGAALLGAGMVQITLNSMRYNGGRVSGVAKWGIILSLLAIITSGLTLIPGIILLLVGLSRPALDTATPISGTKKTLIAIGVFIGGGAIGLGISLIIYFITSTRACQLTSSKCY